MSESDDSEAMRAVATAFSNDDDDDIATALSAVEHHEYLLPPCSRDRRVQRGEGRILGGRLTSFVIFLKGRGAFCETTLVSMADRPFMTRRTLNAASACLALFLIA